MAKKFSYHLFTNNFEHATPAMKLANSITVTGKVFFLNSFHPENRTRYSWKYGSPLIDQLVNQHTEKIEYCECAGLTAEERTKWFALLDEVEKDY